MWGCWRRGRSSRVRRGRARRSRRSRGRARWGSRSWSCRRRRGWAWSCRRWGSQVRGGRLWGGWAWGSRSWGSQTRVGWACRGVRARGVPGVRGGRLVGRGRRPPVPRLRGIGLADRGVRHPFPQWVVGRRPQPLGLRHRYRRRAEPARRADPSGGIRLRRPTPEPGWLGLGHQAPVRRLPARAGGCGAVRYRRRRRRRLGRPLRDRLIARRLDLLAASTPSRPAVIGAAVPPWLSGQHRLDRVVAAIERAHSPSAGDAGLHSGSPRCESTAPKKVIDYQSVSTLMSTTTRVNNAAGATPGGWGG
ncbi:hypothetical protein BKA01_004985 [Pseudonocardia eucalypti]|nr:hypothetical protein [Pseudonocardia eucalypti]